MSSQDGVQHDRNHGERQAHEQYAERCDDHLVCICRGAGKRVTGIAEGLRQSQAQYAGNGPDDVQHSRDGGVRSIGVHLLPPDVSAGPGSTRLTETSGMPKSRTFLSRPYSAA